MKIAQLSDIHFFKNNLNFRTFFSKTLLATLNYYFNRKKNKVDFDIYEIPKLLKEKGVSHIIITGDFTTTSNKYEYALAKKFLDYLNNEGFKTFIIPGNHDTYTKKASLSKRFHEKLKTPKTFKEKSIIYEDFGEGFKWIGLDTTLATPLWSSQGLFSKTLEGKLIKLLDSIPKEQPLILINQFPIETRKHMPFRHQMLRYKRLKEIVESYPNIKLYIFGHTHLSEIIEGKPLKLNSGSLTLTKGGSFHIMDLSKEKVDIEVYSHKTGSWELVENKKVDLP